MCTVNGMTFRAPPCVFLLLSFIQIDQVRSFSHLGTTVNGNNTLVEEIRERIVKGNKSFCAQIELVLKAIWCPRYAN